MLPSDIALADAPAVVFSVILYLLCSWLPVLPLVSYNLLKMAMHMVAMF